MLTRLTALLSLVLAAASFATPTALIQIPTADVLSDDTLCSGLSSTLYPGEASTVGDWWLYNQVGIGHKLEVGYDFALDSPFGGVTNLKWGVDDEGDVKWALGVANIGLSGSTSPNFYGVGQYTDGDWTYYLGAGVRPDPYGFAGVTYMHTNSIKWCADYITGPDGATSLGFDAFFGPEKRWDLMAGWVRGNGGSNGVYVWLGYCKAF